jgi:hypothetical protein
MTWSVIGPDEKPLPGSDQCDEKESSSSETGEHCRQVSVRPEYRTAR